MNLDVFFTAQHQMMLTDSQNQSDGKGALGQKDAASLNGLNFMDMILGLLGDDLQKSQDSQTSEAQHNKTADAAAPLRSDNPLLAETPTLDLAQLIAANPEIEEEIKNFINSTGLDSSVALAQALELNQQSFDNILKPLTDGVITLEDIQKGSPRLLNALLIDDRLEAQIEDEELLDKLELAIAKIEELKANDQASLININLTPAQITVLERQIEQRILQNDAAPEDLAEAAKELNALLSGFVGFAPLAVNKADKTTDQPPPAVQIAAAQKPDSMQQIAGRLNDLNVSSDKGAPNSANADETMPWDDEGFVEDFDALIDKVMRGAVNDKGGPANANTGGAQANTAQNTANPAVLNFQNMPNVILDDAVLQSFEMTPGFMDEFAPLAANGNSAMAALTSLSAQAPQAGAMHPAMQTLAAHIQKMSGSGDTTEFRIQLDPPELGRVEVQMSFGKDKTLKTGIIVERPETYMMLQRDAQMLERTMQDLGLDSEGLDFQLAEQGFDFEGDNKRGGGHDEGGTGAGGEDEDVEIIDSTMTWHVDPESGHMRYNILV